MSPASNDPLRGIRAINSVGFQSVMARTSSFSRLMATQDRINRAFYASDRFDRVMRSAMPLATTQRLGVIPVRTVAVDRAVRDVMPRSFDVAKTYRPVNVSETLRDAGKVQVRRALVDAVSPGAGRSIADTVRASVRAQSALGLRDAGAFSVGATGRRWAEQHRVMTFAGLGETFKKNYGLAGMVESIRVKQRQALLDAARPALRPISWRLDGLGVRSLGTSAFDSYRQSVERHGKTMRELALFIEIWETKALWFLMSSLGIGAARSLRDLPADEAEEAVLDALEEVLLDVKITQALAEVVENHAPHLTRTQRHHLKTFLRLAGEGDWLTAVPPMMAGLEGAFHSAALGQQLITPRGTYINRPSKTVGGADAIIKLLPVDDDYEVFLIRRIFGGTGNPHRHGTADDGEREQILMGIIGLAGWVDEFMGLNATQVLAQEVEKRLPGAAERRRLTIARV